LFSFLFLFFFLLVFVFITFRKVLKRLLSIWSVIMYSWGVIMYSWGAQARDRGLHDPRRISPSIERFEKEQVLITFQKTQGPFEVLYECDTHNEETA
jgi:predicted membrane channel-forming protein YqfA (hemolysin III family)